MAIDSFIKFDGVVGESTDQTHKGEIDVVSWSWGAASSGFLPGGTAGVGKTTAGPLQFLHAYDKASPILAKQCASGKLFKQVTLAARNAVEGQKDFLKVTLKEVLVSSVQAQATADGGIVESVSLAYRDIEFAYQPQDAKGGLGAAVKFGWDIAKATVR